MTSAPGAAQPFTFLFTDIEGSTRLWDHYPEAMSRALQRHDAILHQAIAVHGGHVFKTVGDEFCAVFAQATDALAAALEAQRGLLLPAPETALADGRAPAEPDGPPTIKVRMALHTGAAEARGGDYFGPPLNRVARLMVAGHGGADPALASDRGTGACGAARRDRLA
jgi:class 3 adenylate cyclase